MTMTRIRRIAAIILLVLSFVFESLMLHTDHQKLFNTLSMVSMAAGVSIFPVNTQQNGKIKLIMAIIVLLLITLFILLLAFMNIK